MIVYTVVFDDFDVLRAPVTRPDGVRFVCVTDREPPDAAGWEIRVVQPPPSHPYAQRWHKIQSHLVFPDEDVTLYLDGNLQIRVDPRQLVEEHLGGADLALFEHPQRTGVYEELEACADLGKDRRDLLEAVANRYREEGMPEEGFLHAAGLILRRHTPEIVAFNERWFDELTKTGIRDQPALAYALWKTGVQPTTIETDIWDNELTSFGPHKSKLMPAQRDFLFLCGNPRSGTTALCDLLNEDPRMVIGMERYRRIRDELTPEHFSAARFFAPTPRETTFLPRRLIPPEAAGFSVWPADEAALKQKYASSDLVFVGDKSPFYIRQLPYMHRMFPGARLVIALRDPVSVADSYQRRAENPADHWPTENDYALALSHWNTSIADVVGYIEDFGLTDIFLIDYDSFYSGDVEYLHSLYEFLGLDVETRVVERFEEMTKDWSTHVSRPRLLTSGMEAEIKDGADWEGYWSLKRLIPLMRDYRFIHSERRVQAAAAGAMERERAQHRRVVELARELYAELRHAAVARTDPALVERIDDVWRAFWDIDQSEPDQTADEG